MPSRSPLTHLSSLLFLPTAFSLAAQPPVEEVPRPLLEAAVQAYYPHTTGLELTYETFPQPDGRVEVRCKARRQCVEPTYEYIAELDDVHGTPRPALIVECIRAGLLDPSDADRVKRSDWISRPCERFDPRCEPLLRNVALLREVERVGSVFEAYGTIRARRFIDQWELSEFEPRRTRPGQTLLEVQAEVATFETEPFVTHVLGSREWEDYLAALKPARDERVEKIERANAALQEAVRTGSVYFLKFQPNPRREEFVPLRLEFGGEAGRPGTLLEMSLPTARPNGRAFTVALELRRGGPLPPHRTEAQARADYRRAPELRPELELSALPGKVRGPLARLADRLALRLEQGQLVLVDRTVAPPAVRPLVRDLSGAATARRNGTREHGPLSAEELAFQRY